MFSNLTQPQTYTNETQKISSKSNLSFSRYKMGQGTSSETNTKLNALVGKLSKLEIKDIEAVFMYVLILYIVFVNIILLICILTIL